MQFPVDLVIDGVRIPSHFIFDILSLTIGYTYYTRLKRRDTFDADTRLSVALGAVIGAVAGAKVLALFSDIHTSMFHEFGISYLLLGGKTIVGALIGGIIGTEIAKLISGVRRRTGDIYVFPLILGMMVGRVGCFLTGVSDDTAGLPSSLPWALDQGDGVARHPTALYEIIFLGIVWYALASLLKKQNLPEGVLFRLFIASYLFFRFAIDFLKPGDSILFNMTVIQLAALIGAAWYAFDIYRLYAQRPARP